MLGVVRNDLIAYTDAIKKGATKRQLAEQFPTMMLKFARGTDSLQHALSKPRDSSFNNTVVVYSGTTGSGKTWKAHNELKARFGPDGYYICEGTQTPRSSSYAWRVTKVPQLLYTSCS